MGYTVTDTGIRKVKILTHLKIQNVLCVTVTTLLSLIPSVVLSENNIVPVVGKNLMFDQTEVTIGAFENFVRATGTVKQAERDGGGLVYAGGWEQKAGWTWLTPYGQAWRRANHSEKYRRQNNQPHISKPASNFQPQFTNNRSISWSSFE